MKRILSLIICLLFFPLLHWRQRKQVLNLYLWGGEIPTTVLRQFEKETGIQVNLTTYENNEIMYAKLRDDKKCGV